MSQSQTSERRSQKTLSPEQEKSILAASAAGASQRALAAQFGVGKTTIERLLLARPVAVAQDTAEGIIGLRHDQIQPSTLNPRQHFDDGALEDLAKSIHDNGLLQNLLVRTEPSANGQHTLIAGERRWRAIGRLIAHGSWAPDRLIPSSLMQVDEAGHRVLSILENLQREAISPLEEAEAFRSLTQMEPPRDTRWISQRIGKTQRYVQQRLALLKLCAAARELLDVHRLTIEAARVLCGWTEAEQQEAIDALLADDSRESETFNLADMMGKMPWSVSARERDARRAQQQPDAVTEERARVIDDAHGALLHENFQADDPAEEDATPASREMAPEEPTRMATFIARAPDDTELHRFTIPMRHSAPKVTLWQATQEFNFDDDLCLKIFRELDPQALGRTTNFRVDAYDGDEHLATYPLHMEMRFSVHVAAEGDEPADTAEEDAP